MAAIEVERGSDMFVQGCSDASQHLQWVRKMRRKPPLKVLVVSTLPRHMNKHTYLGTIPFLNSLSRSSLPLNNKPSKSQE
jgi:hypothetical protein